MTAANRILLLRGVNVGGTGKLPMAEFRALLQGLGLGRVQTFIQSGNAVFHDPGLPDLARQITDSIEARFGFRRDAFLYDLDSYADILAANPYRAAGQVDGAKVHILFLATPAPNADLDGLAALASQGEAFTLTPQALYLHAPNGIGTSKLAEKLPRFLQPPQTMRNQRTAQAILDLARAAGP